MNFAKKMGVSLNRRVHVTEKERISQMFTHERYPNKFVNIPLFQVINHEYAFNLREGQKWIETTVREKISNSICKVHLSNLAVI